MYSSPFYLAVYVQERVVKSSKLSDGCIVFYISITLEFLNFPWGVTYCYSSESAIFLFWLYPMFAEDFVEAFGNSNFSTLFLQIKLLYRSLDIEKGFIR